LRVAVEIKTVAQHLYYITKGWLHSTVDRTSVLAGELSLSYARPTADRWPLMWVNRPLQASQLVQLSLSSFWGR